MTSRKYEQGNIDGEKRGMNGDERLKMKMASPDNVSYKGTKREKVSHVTKAESNQIEAKRRRDTLTGRTRGRKTGRAWKGLKMRQTESRVDTLNRFVDVQPCNERQTHQMMGKHFQLCSLKYAFDNTNR